ncbi:protein TIC 40, chloroplastic [Canna indica]|uniref:Protein TIC 40, chloroplastic n=1 Tax=Canna indica TaxID=4628 RepID=A0AAQ3K5Y3_9LILI|nr:protein TIC 40, chloroplastic [Canna indica]
MDNFALVSSKFSLLVAPPNPYEILTRRRPSHSSLPPLLGRRSRRIGSGGRRPGLVLFALNNGRNDRGPSIAGRETLRRHVFASASSSGNSEMTTSSAVASIPVPSSSSSIGSPLFWVGIGVGLSVVFQVVATRLKRYAVQQAFKTMMDQAAPQGGQFNNPVFTPPFPFPPPPPTTRPQPASPSPSTRFSSQQAVMVDVAATKVETTSPSEVGEETQKSQIEEAEPKKFAFVDVSPEELLQNERSYVKESAKASPVDTESVKEIPPNGTLKQDGSASSEQSQSGQAPTILSVEALEKMMEDPTVQKMVYPYLPEEMRNPDTFKWMMQNPQFRQQMQDMLNNMGGTNEWDNRLTESLKNFNLSSPEVKQQFEQIGLTPEEVISKIMANPDVAMAFQNPKVQAAILDCSQNPLSIAKYQNDKEIMDVFTKISELFPGVSGYP